VREATSEGDVGKKGTAVGRRSTARQAEKLKRKDYEKELARLHVELVELQEWVKFKGLKVCVVFEGRDGAGKGGTIKAITERVSPRVFRVVALAAPTEREKSQMYVQRYLPHLPAAGEVVIFDRSWYNRAGVERVMGFCEDEEVERFLRIAPLVEQAIVHSGVILLKYWLEVSPEEQTRRLEARIDDGRKIWKLSPMDLKSYSRWYDYSRARDAMFQATDTNVAPWYVVRSDDKRRARLNLIRHLLSRIPYEHAPREKVKLPKRQKAGGYREPDYPYKYVEELF
jgi:polyphosphate kinase 2